MQFVGRRFADNYYCGECGRYIPKDEARIGRGGRALCPDPHCGNPLRCGPHGASSRRRLKALAEAEKKE